MIAFIMSLPVMMLSLSLHEAAHGFVARKCGDDTAYNFGRITLNPLKHLDPIGFLCLMLVGFGWAKPVPVNSRKFNNPKRGMILTSLAGPISNLILAFLFTVIFRFSVSPLLTRIMLAQTQQQAALFTAIYYFIMYGISMNISLAVFNLLPIPPLDGSKILFSLIPYKAYFKIMPYEKYITMGFALLLILGAFDPVISWVSKYVMALFCLLLGIPVNW